MSQNDTSIENNSGLHALSRYPVLVVEDDPVQRDLLCHTLRAWGLKVFEADSGQSAMTFLDTTKEDVRVLITDIQMPHMDGLTLLKRIKRERPYKFYAIAVSGMGDRRSVQEALRAGANDFLKKPFLPEQLFARLAALDRIVSLEEDYQALVKGLFDVMTEMLGSRDNYTLEHSLRVAGLSTRMAKKMGLSGDALEALELGCLVHDMGKIAIPDDILLKPGPFDELDRTIMNLHPIIGMQFLETRYPDLRVSEITLQHHERLDGSGYPNGLKGDGINPLVRIVMAADVYEALVAQRPYKKPMEKDQALDILDNEVKRGRMDKDAVHFLKEVVNEWDPLSIRRTARVELNEIEQFRKRAYFREPLCSFYNYRYILSLDRDEMMRQSQYFIFIVIDFENIGELNRNEGYLKTDEILDEIGEGIQGIVNLFSEWYGKKKGTGILFRKGPDFIVLSTYDEKVNRDLEKRLRDLLRATQRDWGLKANMNSRRFAGSVSFRKALDLMIGI